MADDDFSRTALFGRLKTHLDESCVKFAESRRAMRARLEEALAPYIQYVRALEQYGYVLSHQVVLTATTAELRIVVETGVPISVEARFVDEAVGDQDMTEASTVDDATTKVILTNNHGGFQVYIDPDDPSYIVGRDALREVALHALTEFIAKAKAENDIP